MGMMGKLCIKEMKKVEMAEQNIISHLVSTDAGPWCISYILKVSVEQPYACIAYHACMQFYSTE